MKTLASAYVNLLKTSIGSGVLNFPYLFKTYGLITTIILTVITGLFAATGLYLLMICSQEMGRGADLGKLAQDSIPWASILIDIAVFMKCFGVALSYMVIAGSLLPSVFNAFFDLKLLTYKPFCLGIFVIAISPFCYLKKMDALKYTSFVGLLSIIFVILASIFRYLYDSTIENVNAIAYATLPDTNWLKGLGKFVFSFTCHQNIFYVFAELENNSLPRMKRLIVITACSAFFLYMSFGVSNYLMYGNAVKDNVLLNYPEDYLTGIVHFLYVIVMGVSYPLQLSPGKNYLMNILSRFFDFENEEVIPLEEIEKTVQVQSDEHLEISTENKKEQKNEVDFLNNQNVSFQNTTIKNREKFKDYVEKIVLTVLIILTYIIAVSGIGLGLIFALVGATASTFMSMILPAIYYLHSDVQKTIFLSITSYIMFLFGVFVFLTTIISLSIKR
ncbi:AVT6 [Ecytonucleospora hepatopenaei]|uniref:AVT6 n=1 Tax=Ecytonucleospora hepatopenaei TaxID=646526 RepID=A0A1W0E8W5_9MICR|nr:AVT6 [Ecytonucleospora hepatopenaei]